MFIIFSIFLFWRFKMKKTSSIWYSLMFVSIWNHTEHIIYVFRHFWLDFMLFLTSKLLKNVNFAALGHFIQHVVFIICVWYHYSINWGLVAIYLIPFPPKIMSRNPKFTFSSYFDVKNSIKSSLKCRNT